VRWLTYRRTLHRLRRIRGEKEADVKKLAWRFGRFGVYVFLAGLGAKFSPVLDAIAPGTTAAVIGGLLAALDKHFGVGGLVAATPTK